MITIVITTGTLGIVGALLIGAFQLLEYSRKKTERSIAIFYRDHPLECTMMLNKISLQETKKEINNLKHKEEMDSKEELINHLQAELDALLQSLELINHYNSLGKTKKIADEIRTILTHYQRNK